MCSHEMNQIESSWVIREMKFNQGINHKKSSSAIIHINLVHPFGGRETFLSLCAKRQSDKCIFLTKHFL